MRAVGIDLPVRGLTLEKDPRWEQAFADTRASLPIEGQDIQSLYAVGGERISFSFQSDDTIFENAENVWFFPESKRILKPAPLRDVTLSPGMVQITHEQARRFRVENDQINGVLSVEDRSGNVQGYLVTAIPASAANLSSVTALAANASGGVDGASGGPGLLTVIFFALAGGLILNLMPCVFPVLSLKVLSFASKGQAEHAEQRMHGLAYTAGIIVTFMALADRKSVV